MKKEINDNHNTVNAAQEDEDMREETEEKREQLIDSIEIWYVDSYMMILDMERSHYKPWLV